MSLAFAQSPTRTISSLVATADSAFFVSGSYFQLLMVSNYVGDSAVQILTGAPNVHRYCSIQSNI